jgi:hypothetical protein
VFYDDPNDPIVTNFADMAAAVATMKTDLGAGSAKAITIFFHGGLVDESHGYSTAASLLGPYGNVPNEDVSSPGDSYPYFFLYETGVWQALQDVGSDVLGSVFFKQLLSHFVPNLQQVFPDGPAVRALSLGASSSSPPHAVLNATIARIQQEVGADPLINAECERIANYHAATQSQTMAATPFSATLDDMDRGDPVAAHMQADVRASIAADVTAGRLGQSRAPAGGVQAMAFTIPTGLGFLKDVADIGWRIVNRFLSHHDHGVVCTTVEEIIREIFLDDLGFDVWADMKAAADAACDRTKNGVAAAFIDQLDQTFWSKGEFPRVVLVGHSEGAHFVCRWLQAIDDIIGAKYDPTLTFDVLFMAAACRTDVFADVLTSTAGKRIKQYRSLCLSDPVEQADHLLDAVNPLLGEIYPRSLLYYISGVLERNGTTDFPDAPLVGMQRFFSGNVPFQPSQCSADVTTVAGFAGKESAYAPTPAGAAPGWQCDAAHHGGMGKTGFPLEPNTLRSCCYLIATPSW